MAFGNVEELNIEDIIVEDRARIDVGDLTELMESIKTHGLINPITIDNNKRLIAGGRRLAAHIALDRKTIRTISVGTITSEEASVIELIENYVRKDFHWTEEVKLKKKIHDQLDLYAQAKGIDNWSERKTAEKLGVAKSNLGRDLILAAAMQTFPELATSETKGKALKQYEKIKLRVGAALTLNRMTDEERKQIEQMQENSGIELIIENPENDSKSWDIAPTSTEETCTQNSLPKCTYLIGSWKETLNNFPESSLGFVEMDPPYAMDFENTYGQAQKTQVDFKDWDGDTFKKEMTELINTLPSKLMLDSWVLCWTAFEWVPFLMETAEAAGFRVQRPGIWAKPGGSTNALSYNLVSNYEVYLLFAHGKPMFNTPKLNAAFTASNLSGSDKIHATEKPVEGVYDHLFSALAKPGTNFFSPFAGSGNCLFAAHESGMIPFGCDIKDSYKDHFYARLLKRYTK